jgi:ACS family tartrate transporter-like MFS transporter
MHEQLHAHPAPLRSVVERKLFLWLIAPIALITFVNSIDRVNVSYAGSAMSADLGLSPSQFGQGVSMFFVAYLLFQYPHVRLLRAWGIKPWILVSMLLWGLSGLWMSQIETAAEFYAARFLLGMAEAGFAPGMTWLISRWAPPSIRARALAGALVAVPLSMVLGGPLCGWLLGIANPLELAPWRFMFLMLAVPNALLAVAAMLYLVDEPAKARWLSAEERNWLDREFETGEPPSPGPAPTVAQLAGDPCCGRCALTWLLDHDGLLRTGSSWLPQIVRQMDIGGSELMIATLSALPLLGLAIGLMANGGRSDRAGRTASPRRHPSAFRRALPIVAAALLDPDGRCWRCCSWPALDRGPQGRVLDGPRSGAARRSARCPPG